jgi:CRP-like cAMP-binding protein
MTEGAHRFADLDDLIEEVERQKIILGDRQVARALAEAGDVKTFQAGAELIRQGDRDDDCYFLLSGEVEIRINGDVLPYGRGPGDVVGEFSAINKAIPRTATIVAKEEVVALRCTAATLKAAGKAEPRLWRLLAVEMTNKVFQRNQLIATVNERPRIFMISADGRGDVAQALETMLSRDYVVDLWSEDDRPASGDYELEALGVRAKEADFGIVLAHPHDLGGSVAQESEASWKTLRFELGYMISELTRHRTLLLVPCGSEPPRLFKGLQPMTYELPTCGMPLQVALAKAIDDIRAIVDDRKVRSRLRQQS